MSLCGDGKCVFIFCPNYVSHNSPLRSNEAGGGAQGVFRVVVRCVLLLSVDSVGPWALPVEEAQHFYLL